MPNLGELNSYLYNCNLVKPDQDAWESFKRALTPFVDCWWGDTAATFKQTPDTLEVAFEEQPIIRFKYRESREYPMRVTCREGQTSEIDTGYFAPDLADAEYC